MKKFERASLEGGRFGLCVVGVCLLMVLVSVAVASGPTTGQLQEQIDELIGYVERLRGLIEDPEGKSYTAGIAGVFEYQDCLKVDKDLDCEAGTVVVVDVLEGWEVFFEAIRIYYIDEVQYEEVVDYFIEKVPGAGPLSDRDYHVNVRMREGGDEFSFDVSPEDPVYSSKHDDAFPEDMVNVRCELVNDWRIRIISDIFNIKNVLTESLGIITEAYFEPFTESAGKAELKVSVKNIGDYATSYMVTATGFGDMIEPVAVKSVFLEDGESDEITFIVRSAGTFEGQGPCRVTLKGMHGKVYDEVLVDFPEPLPDPEAKVYLPDFDGDGDVDLVDLGQFAGYWLEGAGP